MPPVTIADTSIYLTKLKAMDTIKDKFSEGYRKSSQSKGCYEQ
jgi:hypothetical protein